MSISTTKKGTGKDNQGKERMSLNAIAFITQNLKELTSEDGPKGLLFEKVRQLQGGKLGELEEEAHLGNENDVQKEEEKQSALKHVQDMVSEYHKRWNTSCGYVDFHGRLSKGQPKFSFLKNSNSFTQSSGKITRQTIPRATKLSQSKTSQKESPEPASNRGKVESVQSKMKLQQSRELQDLDRMEEEIESAEMSRRPQANDQTEDPLYRAIKHKIESQKQLPIVKIISGAKWDEHELIRELSEQSSNTKPSMQSQSKPPSLSQTIRQSALSSQLRHQMMNKVESLSHFFKLNNSYPETLDQQKMHISQVGSQVHVMIIDQPKNTYPSFQEWFESLSLQDKILSMTTIDSDITGTLKRMYQQVTKLDCLQHGKFRMQVGEYNQLQRERYSLQCLQNRVMQLQNSKAHLSSSEVVQSEAKILDYIIFTDTFNIHDTLSVHDGLVQSPQKFYSLAQTVVGTHFMQKPHKVEFIQTSQFCHFETSAPLWLDMPQPNSLVQWILFFLERALSIQYLIYIKKEFTNLVDLHGKSLHISPDNHIIGIQNNFKVYWRAFCQQQDGILRDKLLTRMRSQAFSSFGLDQSASSEAARILQCRVETFLTEVQKMITNQSKGMQPQLSLYQLCKEKLQKARFFFSTDQIYIIVESLNRALKQRTSDLDLSQFPEQSALIEMQLERILVQCFQDIIEVHLKNQVTPTTKKAQKKKNKKKKAEGGEDSVLGVSEESSNSLSQKPDAPLPPSAAGQLGESKKKKKGKKKKLEDDEAKTQSGRKRYINLEIGPNDTGLKPSTPKEAQNNNAKDQKLKPEKMDNFFEEAQFQLTTSHQSSRLGTHSCQASEMSGALPPTIQTYSKEAHTISTSEASKEPEIVVKSSQVQNAMSNDEIIRILTQKEEDDNPASKYITHWQRQNGLSNMVNALLGQGKVELSEQSDESDQSDIKVQLKRKKEHKVKAQVKAPRASRKKGGKGNERSKSSNSSGSGSVVLPDINTNYQPEDNDSSMYDYGGENMVEHESLDEEVLSGVNKSQPNSNQETRAQQRNTPSKKQQQNRILKASLSKKSIKSANPKIVGVRRQKPFQPQLFEEHELIEPMPELFIEQEKINHRWTQLKPNPPLTLVWVTMTKEFHSQIQYSKNNNKKSKKERKQDWEAKFASTQPVLETKQIQIIKPQLQKGEVVQESNNLSDNGKKKQKKKAAQQLTSSEALNKFMLQKQGGSYDVEPKPEKAQNVEEDLHPRPTVKEEKKEEVLYKYQAKEKQPQKKQSTDTMPITSGKAACQLNPESKEFHVTRKPLIEEKKAMSGKSRKKKEQQDMTMDHMTLLQQLYAYQHLNWQMQTNSQLPLSEPNSDCNILNLERYELFFEDLKQEMLLEVQKIDELKESVSMHKQQFIQLAQLIVKGLFENKNGNGEVDVHLYGSMATQLAIETSDIDLLVTGIQVSGDSIDFKSQMIETMQQLYDEFRKLKTQGLLKKMKFLSGASVPIIKLVIDLEVIAQNSTRCGPPAPIDPSIKDLKVDITLDVSAHTASSDRARQGDTNHNGLDAISHIQTLVAQRPDLRPIVMIIKKAFDETYVSMPFHGGINSYSLVIMVFAFLKKFDSNCVKSIGWNLMRFFKYFGDEFSPSMSYLDEHAVICDEREGLSFQDQFVVIDPMDLSHNICQSAFRFPEIQQALVHTYQIINSGCQQFQVQSSIHGSSAKVVLDRLLTEPKQINNVPEMQYDDI